MDAMLHAAARCLSRGDPLGALDRVALRQDPEALALRATALAQLGEWRQALSLFRQARRKFRPGDRLHRARCVLAEAEVALALRDLTAGAELENAIQQLATHDDAINANYGRLISARRELLLGELEAVDHSLGQLDLTEAPSLLAAVAGLVEAQAAARRAQAKRALGALHRARAAAKKTGAPALMAEVERAFEELARPAARLQRTEQPTFLSLAEVEALFRSDVCVVDGCRRHLRRAGDVRKLVTRPVLFALAASLARACPENVSRADLVRDAFEAALNDSLRARLRVEIGRLRKLARGLFEIRSTSTGYRIEPVENEDVVLIEPPIPGRDGALEALLSDGSAWSAPSLALALGVNVRTAQRGLARLAEQGRVEPLGAGRARRWQARPLAEFTTAMLLPSTGLVG